MESRNRQQWHQRIRAGAGLCVVFLVVLIAEGMFRPGGDSSAQTEWPEQRTQSRPAGEGGDAVPMWLRAVAQRRLFKPATPLPARRMADQTVNKVRSMIHLNAIMTKNGEHIAYIRIKDTGLQAFKVGDQIEELFAVTQINKSSVELEVAGERIRLDL